MEVVSLHSLGIFSFFRSGEKDSILNKWRARSHENESRDLFALYTYVFVSVCGRTIWQCCIFIVLFSPFPVFGMGIDYLEQFGSSSVSMTVIFCLPSWQRGEESKDESVKP